MSAAGSLQMFFFISLYSAAAGRADNMDRCISALLSSADSVSCPRAEYRYSQLAQYTTV